LPDFELLYALLDNGTLTLGFAVFCLLFTLVHLAFKHRLQKDSLLPVFRIVVAAAFLVTVATFWPFYKNRIWQTLADKISERPFASQVSLQQAAEYYEKALKTGCWNTGLLRNYASCLVRSGKGSEAARLLTSGPWSESEHPELLLPTARALLAAGRNDAAVETARKALQLNDEFERFWAMRTAAEAYIASNQHEMAAQFLESCLATVGDQTTRQILQSKARDIRQGKNWLEDQ